MNNDIKMAETTSNKMMEISSIVAGNSWLDEIEFSEYEKFIEENKMSKSPFTISLVVSNDLSVSKMVTCDRVGKTIKLARSDTPQKHKLDFMMSMDELCTMRQLLAKWLDTTQLEKLVVSFSPTGIGNRIVMKMNDLEEADISDYSTW